MASLSSFDIRGSLAFGASFASLVRRLEPSTHGRARYGVLDGHEVLSVTELTSSGNPMPRTSLAVQLPAPLFLQLLVHPRGPQVLYTVPEPLPGILLGDERWDRAYFVTAEEEERARMLLSPEVRASMQQALYPALGGAWSLALNDTMVGLMFDGTSHREELTLQILRGLIACGARLHEQSRTLPPAPVLARLSNEWAELASERHMTFDAERMHMHAGFPTWSLDVALEPTPRCVYVAVTARLAISLDVAFELHEGHMGWLARKIDHAITTGDDDIDEHYVVHADAKEQVAQLVQLPAVHALLLHQDAEVSLSSSHVFLRVPGLDPTIAMKQVTAAAHAMMGTDEDADRRPYR